MPPTARALPRTLVARSNASATSCRTCSVGRTGIGATRPSTSRRARASTGWARVVTSRRSGFMRGPAPSAGLRSRRSRPIPQASSGPSRIISRSASTARRTKRGGVCRATPSSRTTRGPGMSSTLKPSPCTTRPPSGSRPPRGRGAMGRAAVGPRSDFRAGACRAAQAGWKFTLEAHAITFINATSHATSQVMYPAAVTIDLTQSGPVADGRDRATALSANSWAHLYWIYDGTTVSGIISPDAPVIRGTPVGGGPNLTGLAYTSWAYAGTVRLGALGDGVNPDIVPVHILGAMAYYHMGARVLSGGTSTTEATVDLATVVPPTATHSLPNVMARLAANGGEVTIRYSNASAGGSRDFLTMRSGAAAVDYRNSTQALVPNVSQRVYYIVILAGGTVQVDLDVLGYKLPVGG